MSCVIERVIYSEYDTSTGVNSIRAHLICDDQSDLPAQSYDASTELMIGCQAHVISDGSEWELDSTGSWIQQPGRFQLDLTGYATENYVDDAIADTEQYADDAVSTYDAQITPIIKYLLGYSHKNLIPYTLASAIANASSDGSWSGNVYTRRGITFTINDDMSITVQGTATANSWLKLTGDFTLTTDSILSGCPAGGGGSTYEIQWTPSGGEYYHDYGNTAQIPARNTGSIQIGIRSGTAILTPITFTPMIADKTIYQYDSIYQPYAPTNRELYEMILAL